MATEGIRTLKIKTSVVSRTCKELLSYVKELEENEKKTEEIRQSSDHSKLKQWENVCAETQGMIPDTESRLRNALEDLNALLNVPAYEGTSELKSAQEAVETANDALSKRGTVANGDGN